MFGAKPVNGVGGLEGDGAAKKFHRASFHYSVQFTDSIHGAFRFVNVDFISEYLFVLPLRRHWAYVMMDKSESMLRKAVFMIAFVRGPLMEIEEDSVVVETGGMGLEIRVPLPVLEQLPALGQEVKLYTYFQVKEDGMSLFGFLSPQDKSMFKRLIGVNGVGPKGALGILSVLRPDDLRMAVISGDAKAIARAPGIGVKTAQRVILDLKDKVSMDEVMEGFLPSAGSGKEEAAGALGLAGAAREAVMALTALGYSNLEASKAVKKAELTEGMTTEEALKAALKHLSFL